MPDERTNMLAIFRAELLWAIVLVLALIATWIAATFAEKIAALEDVVFNEGLYKQIERKAEDGER